jgi:hypothetical protein
VTNISQSRSARLFLIACLLLTLAFVGLATPVSADDSPINPPILEPPPLDPGPLGLLVPGPSTLLVISEVISVI